jgi:hypothetical protein
MRTPPIPPESPQHSAVIATKSGLRNETRLVDAVSLEEAVCCVI